MSLRTKVLRVKRSCKDLLILLVNIKTYCDLSIAMDGVKWPRHLKEHQKTSWSGEDTRIKGT